MSVRIVIKGRVQGVSYRAWTVKQAQKLNLNGWVRNLSDGSVEALFSGNDEAIKSMIDACKKGPMMARVDAIDSYKAEEPDVEGFWQKPTL